MLIQSETQQKEFYGSGSYRYGKSKTTNHRTSCVDCIGMTISDVHSSHSGTLTSPSASRWSTRLLFLERAVPKVRFMVHDRWANVLFLHWRVPDHLEEILVQHTAPFVLDRFDGSAWIGLILLTEENVGPCLGRKYSQWTCVTHHGINVRTYVQGLPSTAPKVPGIHFASLECDDEFTSWGANFFGMPYRVAKMSRTYAILSENDTRSLYRIQSSRLPDSLPSLTRVLYHALRWWQQRRLHTTEGFHKDTHKNDDFGTQQQSINASNDTITIKQSSTNESPSSAQSPTTFSVDCSWSSRSSTPEERPPHDDSAFTTWACERYHVYTHKYHCPWRGTVSHEPWPMIQDICLQNLTIQGIESYEPKELRPLLFHMAGCPPDKVGFSPGVGPVSFQMLQPLSEETLQR